MNKKSCNIMAEPASRWRFGVCLATAPTIGTQPLIL